MLDIKLIIEIPDLIKEKLLKKGYEVNFDEIIKKEILRIILKDIYKKDINLITNVHLNQILDLKKSNSTLDFPKDLKIIKSYDNITFKKEKTISDNTRIADKDART